MVNTSNRRFNETNSFIDKGRKINYNFKSKKREGKKNGR